MKTKNGMRAFCLLLVMALVGAIFVPAVSAEESKNISSVNSDSKNIDEQIDLLFNEALEEKFSKSQINDEFINSYTSPVDKAINILKKNGISDSEITEKLNKYGYGWYPKTGAWWKGTSATPEQEKYLEKIRGPEYSPNLEDNTFLKMSSQGSDHFRQMRTKDSESTKYYAVEIQMKPGNMNVDSSGTTDHAVTTHVGKKKADVTECWTEAGIYNYAANPGRQKFTYDNDEGYWSFLGSASSDNYCEYKILVTKYFRICRL